MPNYHEACIKIKAENWCYVRTPPCVRPMYLFFALPALSRRALADVDIGDHSFCAHKKEMENHSEIRNASVVRADGLNGFI